MYKNGDILHDRRDHLNTTYFEVVHDEDHPSHIMGRNWVRGLLIDQVSEGHFIRERACVYTHIDRWELVTDPTLLKIIRLSVL